jgi:LuxR family maltose regulon positive regulatory protein
LASPSLTPQGYLRAELRRRNPTALPRLHRTAALWCLQHGEPMAAIGHAVEGQDNDLAASLVTACLVTA